MEKFHEYFTVTCNIRKYPAITRITLVLIRYDFDVRKSILKIGVNEVAIVSNWLEQISGEALA